uniref:Uncharacterized protein n=1 Tax=Tanacetum cinerariifolium TaxID=118510 RepID=A0A699HML4_TANCI|nr:hypothetical protein [Tanacetum cinerariifolium]
MSSSHISIYSDSNDESTNSYVSYIILSDSEAEDTASPIGLAPPSPDYIPALPDYAPASNTKTEPFKAQTSPNYTLDLDTLRVVWHVESFEISVRLHTLGPHMIREVHEGELYKIIDASDHSLIQTAKGTNLHSLESSGSKSLSKYSWMGVIQLSSSLVSTYRTSFSSIDLLARTSTSTSLISLTAGDVLSCRVNYLIIKFTFRFSRQNLKQHFNEQCTWSRWSLCLRDWHRTRRPQHRNNPKSDKVPFKSKSSCLSNNLEKIEENHRTKKFMEKMNVTLDEPSAMACNQMSDCNPFFK